MAVKKVELESQLVLGIREIGPYKKIKELLGKLYPYAVSRGIKVTGPPIFICHEMGEDARKADEQGNADIQVCIPVKESMEIDSEGMDLGLAFYQLRGGKFAKTVHKGPYENCEASYDELFEWIKDKGYKITGPIREVYMNDPNEVKPEKIKTEIYVPIEEGKEDKVLWREEE